MEAYTFGAALGAFAVAAVALLRTVPCRTSVVVRPVSWNGGRGRRRPADCLLRVVPGACAAAAVALVVGTFASQNTEAVSVRFLDWHIDELPLAAAILASGLVAGFAVAAAALIQRRRLLARIDRLEHQLRAVSQSASRPYRYRGVGRTSTGRNAHLRSVRSAGKALNELSDMPDPGRPQCG